MYKSLYVRIIRRCPTNYVRILFYRKLLGYRIGENVKIGRCTINCNTVIIGDNVLIRDNNSISCDSLSVGSNTKIHSGNIIQGSSSFSMGNNSRIINEHFIDLWNDVKIGNNTWLAGKGSQLWTHGSIHTKTGLKNLSIHIMDDVYVGSGVKIAPGVLIKSINLIGLGSVVYQSVLTQKNIIVGNPATIVKEKIDWRENW
jgi:acetyltransferase-like isoleucine patch superfamily enzyme